jgi:hypothetical protein
MDLGAVSERERCHLKETSRTFTSAQAGGEARGRDIAVTAGTAAEGRWQVVQWQSLLMYRGLCLGLTVGIPRSELLVAEGRHAALKNGKLELWVGSM